MVCIGLMLMMLCCRVGMVKFCVNFVFLCRFGMVSLVRLRLIGILIFILSEWCEFGLLIVIILCVGFLMMMW